MKTTLAIVAGTLAATAPCTQACTPATKQPAVEAGSYAAALESCLMSATSCEAYVACQHDAQARFSQPLSGSCTLTDAGVDDDAGKATPQ